MPYVCVPFIESYYLVLIDEPLTSLRPRRRSLFRTMGLRHIVVVDGELFVRGVITRTEMNEHHLKHFWEEEVRVTHRRDLLRVIVISTCMRCLQITSSHDLIS